MLPLPLHLPLQLPLPIPLVSIIPNAFNVAIIHLSFLFNFFYFLFLFFVFFLLTFKISFIAWISSSIFSKLEFSFLLLFLLSYFCFFYFLSFNCICLYLKEGSTLSSGLAITWLAISTLHSFNCCCRCFNRCFYCSYISLKSNCICYCFTFVCL